MGTGQDEWDQDFGQLLSPYFSLYTFASWSKHEKNTNGKNNFFYVIQKYILEVLIVCEILLGIQKVTKLMKILPPWKTCSRSMSDSG